MTAFQGIEAVVYDLDGTMINSQKIHEDGWREAGRKYGVKVTEQMLIDQKGIQVLESARIMLGKNSQVNPTEFAAAQREYATLHLPEAELFPDFIKTYDALAGIGKKVWVCTSSEEELVKSVLQNHEELQRLEGKIVWLGMYKDPKPSGNPLLLTLEKMGNFKPDQALYVGDAYSDYLSACAAGFKFCYFCPPDVTPDPRIPNHVKKIKAHSELLGILK